MSETFAQTRKSFRRLTALLREADEDTRYHFAYWVIGHVLMFSSIVAQFGWNGLIFCVGLLLWTVSNRP